MTDEETFRDGEEICCVNAQAHDVERWVTRLGRIADARVGWLYVEGEARVLHLGDEDSRDRVTMAILQTAHQLKGTIVLRGD